MQSVASSELACAPELNEFHITCVRQSDLILSVIRTGTLRDPATIQSAHDRARALAFIAKMLVQLEHGRDLSARSYLGAVDTGKLSDVDLSLLHKCFNAWRERIAEAVEIESSF